MQYIDDPSCADVLIERRLLPTIKEQHRKSLLNARGRELGRLYCCRRHRNRSGMAVLDSLKRPTLPHLHKRQLHVESTTQ
jgi:hypothetical protein